MKNRIRMTRRKILALMLAVAFANAPMAFAQSDTSSTTPDAPVAAAVTDAVAADTSATSSAAASPPDMSQSAATTSADLQGSGSATVQDTYNGQSAVVSGDSLMSTADPQAASSTDSVAIPLAADTGTSSIATTTLVIVAPAATPATPVVAGTSTADVVAQGIDPQAQSASDDPDTTAAPDPHDTAQVRPAAVAAIPLSALTPGPEYSFALSGDPIPTTATVVSPDGSKHSSTVDAPLSPVVDSTTSAVTISGQCADDYFVVLLFAQKNDYAENPSSYILNKAYPCAGGAFTYSISDLPRTLPDGLYYLLVGEEGKSGAWKPITALSPITITRNNH